MFLGPVAQPGQSERLRTARSRVQIPAGSLENHEIRDRVESVYGHSVSGIQDVSSNQKQTYVLDTSDGEVVYQRCESPQFRESFRCEVLLLEQMRDVRTPVPKVLWRELENTPEAVISSAPGKEVSEFYGEQNFEQAGDVVKQTGTTLSQIHKKKFNHSGKLSTQGGLELKARVWEDILAEIFGDYVHQLQGSRFEDSITDAVALFDNGLELVDEHGSCLVHYDVAPDNVFWENGNISSVIDWGRAMSGDPAFDLAYAQVQFVLAFYDGREAEQLNRLLFGSYHTESLRGEWHKRMWFYRKLFIVEAMKSFESWTESQGMSEEEKQESAEWNRDQLSQAAAELR